MHETMLSGVSEDTVESVTGLTIELHFQQY